MSPKTRRVLNVLTLQWQYTVDVAAEAGVGVNTVYAALDTLDEEGAIEQTFDFSSDPVRHLVRLSEAGYRLSRESHGTQKHPAFAFNAG